jgi:3-methyladenine DNA glycosylase AlkC
VAELLKNSFGAEVVQAIAGSLASAWESFDEAGFIADSVDGLDELELTDRAKHVAATMASHLPEDRAEALRILTASLGPEDEELTGMEGFKYLPHGYFIAGHGLDHFESAMEAQYQLTKRFTAEFSIRAYLEHHPAATLERLRLWSTDPSEHPRRLVSEGTRPRLPWAPRLREFQRDPTPVLELLELLKDDPSEYVRRSVANNINDIAKDHPAIAVDVAKRWWTDADDNRRRLIRHALRSLIKAGNSDALAVLGYGPDSPIEALSVSIDPPRVAIGDKIRINASLTNPTGSACGALVDIRIHFVKANGETSPKVFKGGEVEIGPGASSSLSKTVSLKQHSTRKHYAGIHRVEFLINGEPRPGAQFGLLG